MCICKHVALWTTVQMRAAGLGAGFWGALTPLQGPTQSSTSGGGVVDPFVLVQLRSYRRGRTHTGMQYTKLYVQF